MALFKQKFPDSNRYLIDGDPLKLLNVFINRQIERMRVEILMAITGRDSIVITSVETNKIIREHVMNIRMILGKSEYFKFITQEYFGSDKAIMHYMTEELFSAYNMIHTENAAKRRAVTEKQNEALE